MSRVRSFDFTSAGNLTFGAGASAAVGEQRALRKAQKIGLISDAGVVSAGLVDGVKRSLGERLAFVDTEVIPDADVAHIDTLAARCAASSRSRRPASHSRSRGGSSCPSGQR